PGTHQLPTVTPRAHESPCLPTHAERVNPQPQVLLQSPVEDRPENDRQTFDPVERAAGAEGERGAGLGRAPRLLQAEVLEPATGTCGREGDLFTLRPVRQRLAVGPHLPGDRRAGVAREC